MMTVLRLSYLLLAATYVCFSPHPGAAQHQFGAEHVLEESNAAGVEAVRPADLDGDGYPDLLAALSIAGHIVWYRNSGGSYGPGEIIADRAPRASSVHAADLDGDGDLDVVGASPGDSTVFWHENEGGVFGPRQVIAADIPGAETISSADLDDDGDLDVVTGTSTGTIAWYENTRQGIAEEHVILSNANALREIQAADIDGDGDPDLVSAAGHSGAPVKVAWYENDDGTFTRHVLETSPGGAGSIDLADLDGDADLDIVASFYMGGKILWYENQDGRFAPAKSISDNNWGGAAVRTADLDGDGDQDILGTVATSVGWYENEGDSFGPVQVITTGPGIVVSIETADVNRDGRIDPIVGSESALSWVSRQSEEYDERRFIAPASRMPAANRARSADLDLDEDADIIAVTETGKVVWYENQRGDFGDPRVIPTANGRTKALDAADVDGDGDLDIITGSLGQSGRRNTLAWYENTDDGINSARMITTRASRVSALEPADIDGDGDIDLLYGSYGSDDRVAWFENRGGGTFADEAHLIAELTDTPGHLAASDLDGDSDPDVIVTAGGRVRWFENGGGTFREEHVVHRTVESASLAIASDIDRDGDADVISANWKGDISWHENMGGQFTRQQMITPASEAGRGLSSLYTADVDGDNDKDLAAALYKKNQIIWFENEWGAFEQPAVIANDAYGASSVHAGDVNGDGALDILYAAKHNDKIAWVENAGLQQSRPPATRMLQNHPNPFNHHSTIRYEIPRSGHVELNMYDTMGRKVATLVDGVQNAGRYSISFDGSDLPSGLYIYRLETGTRTLSRTMLLVK